LLLAGTLCGALALTALAEPAKRGGGVATRIIFAAGKARQCDRGCRPAKDVLRSISPHGARERRLAEIRSIVEISATEDGDRVAVLSKVVVGGGANSAAFTQVYLLSSNGRISEVFDQRIEGFAATGLGISANGGLLALSGRGPRSQGFPAGSKIVIVRANGSGLRQLTTGPGVDSQPAFSPSGKQVVFVRGGVGGDRDDEIYRVGIGGGRQTKLTSNAVDDVNPVYSPDGKHILFGQTPRGPNKVMIMRSNGSRLRTVTRIGLEFPDPDFSPNGENVVYVGDVGRSSGIFTVRVSGARKRLASGAFPTARLPNWANSR
jgi:hypothetical protein